MRIPGSSHDEQVDRRLDDFYDQLAAERRRPGGDGDAAVGWGRLPVPGRHASRRAAEGPRARARTVASLVPAPLRGAAALGPPQLAVVAVLVALGLAVTSWWVIRSDPREVQAPPATLQTAAPDLVALTPVAAGPEAGEALPAASGTTPTQDAPGSPAAALTTGPAPEPGSGSVPAGSGAATATVTVDVAGRVRRPGVVVLPAGSRVVDALAAAGGARRGTGLASLNRARVLVDGEQVLVGPPPRGVPSTSAPLAPSVPTGAGAVEGGIALVDLNTADQATLETLPQVGPVTAQAILAWRDQHGSFTAVEELLEVDGIGEVTLAQISPHATV